VIEDETFGFFSVGTTASLPLAFVPECYGKWTASAGVTYYYLGEGTDDFNTAPRGGSVREANNSEWVFSGGLIVVF
jgi:hypothetical protein